MPASDLLLPSLQDGDGASWVSVKHNIIGAPIDGITRGFYKRSQKKQNNSGASKKPNNRTRGKYEFDAGCRLYLGTAMAIQTVSPNNSLLDCPPFTYIQQVMIGTQLYTIVMKYCEFTEEGFEGNEDDMSLEMDLPLIVGDIEVRKGN